MKSLILAAMLSSVSALASEVPLLVKTLGGLDIQSGVTVSNVCSIYRNFSNEVDPEAVINLIKQAEKENIDKFVHVKRQVPSVEVYAYYQEKNAVGPAAKGLRNVKVLLLTDSSDGKQRAGKAAGELLEIVDQYCPK